ncbi:MAG TPA: HYR domain-containing protein [Saprospiraceae bacterium]|nr:HYR domain-containing protein [Saprospiraceae bacterium]
MVKRRLTLLSLLLLGMGFACLNAQTANTYVYTTSTGATLDPMTGASTAVASNVDDIPSGLLSIGFDFVYETTTYTQFSVSPDGFIKLGSPAASSQFTNAITSTTNIPKLFPFWDDLATGTTGSVTYVVTGSAPNRILKVQWFVTIPRNTTGPANSTMQAWLYEGTNVIEFRYGAVGGTTTSASVGINGTTATNFHSITTTTHVSSTTTANDANTAWPGSGRMYTFTPPPACMGAPVAGTTASSANPACAGVNFTLSLSGNTQGLGIAYQWQSSPDGVSFTNITGATSSTLATSLTAPTWYHCVVTCNNSGQSATSTDLLVGLAPPTQCYCTPIYTSGCGSSDRIDKVTFGVLINPTSGNSGCTNNNGVGYNQYLSGLPIPNLGVGSTNPISVLVGPGGTEHVKIFIDLNQDGDFLDTGEENYIGSGNGVTISGNVVIPAGATTGQTRMRVRVVYNTNVFGPCTSHSFGEAEDYLVNIVAPPSCLAGPTAPANGSSSCAPAGSTTLSWPAAADATSYDVYFGTSSNPPLVANVTVTSYNAGNLGLGTYFWKIVPKNVAGDATGCPTWSFTYADAQAPVISSCGSNQTLFANANCQAALGNYTGNVVFTDNCPGVVIVTQNPVAGTLISANTTVTFTVKDAANNSATCSISVAFVDDTDPVINCPAVVNVGTASNACSAVATFSVSATDNCDNSVTITQTGGPASGSTFNIGATPVSFSAEDNAGNVSTCAFNVIVSDDDAPVISVCPPNVAVTTDDNCQVETADYTGLVVASDNCDPDFTVVQDPAPGTVSAGFLTITMTVTDNAGNASTCSFQTTADDMTPPTISCPDPQYFNADDDCQTPLPDFTDLANASDNCGGFLVTQSPAAGTEVGFGQTLVTLTVTDGPGLSASCVMEAYSVDVTPPVITCPPSVTLETDPNTCTAVAMFMCPVAPDNCSGSANPEQILGLPSGSSFPKGVNVVGYQATDASGNSASCTFTITVIDLDPPYLSCPFNIVKNTDPGLCSAITTWSTPTTLDNCDVPTLVQTGGPVSGSAFPKGTTTVSFKSTDASGNSTTCSFTVTVNDNEAPKITCPANIVKSNDLNQCGAIVTFPTPTFSDNCPGATIMQIAGLASGAFFPKGVTTNIFKVTDASGNTATCSFTVTVNDTQLPTITCPANIVKNNDPNQCGAIVTFPNPTFSDNCPGAVLTQIGGLPSGSFFPVGTTTNIFKVTDASGNMSTCSFTVKVNDVQAPVFNNCPGTITKVNDPGVCGAVVTWPKITASDNCPGVVVTFVSGMASGSLFAVGTTTVVYKATDASGNMATCSFNVVVLDNENPSITCPADIVKNNDINKCSATITYIGSAFATDNCGVKSITNDNPGPVFPVGVTTVTWTAVDAAGNDVTCQQTITVKDVQPPLIKCPDHNIIVFNDPELACQAYVEYEVTATDNCPGVVVNTSEWPPSENGYFSIGTTIVMATATDAAGNQSMCQFCIVVNPAPEICNGLDDDCDGLTDETDDAWRQSDKQLVDNGQTGDLYGASVAVYGSFAVVGAKNADGNGSNSGLAYVLQNNDSNPDDWQQVAVLNTGDVEADDLFGASVAVYTNLIVVGAPQDDDLGANAGAAYIFARNTSNNTWNLVKKITAADGFANDNFGAAVSVQGDKILVGASMNDEKGLNAGAAYLFSKNQGGTNNWGQVVKITAADGEAADMFGASLKIDGDFAVIGAALEDEKGVNAGAAYLFGKDQGGANAWGLVKKLLANDGYALDNFGISVGISADAVIVGANQNDDNGSNSGSAYIFERNNGGTNNWGQAAKLLATDGTANDQLGYAVAVNGNFAVVGARFDNIKGTNSGAAYVWERQQGYWVYVNKLYDTQGDKNDQFGTVLDIYKRNIIIGALRDDVAGKTDQGSVSFFVAGCDDNFNGNPADKFVSGGTKVKAFEVKAYPQPFSDVLNIEVNVPAAKNARVVIWNVYGQEVATVYNGSLDGQTTLQWNAEGFAAGTYFLRVEADNETEVKSILLVR